MARKLIVEIVGDTSSLEKAFRKTGTDARTFAEKTTSMGSRLAKTGLFAGAAAGVGLLTEAFKTGYDEYNQAQQAQAQIAAGIKTTGGAANVTAGHIDELSKRILNYSGIDDEAVKSADSMLLKFRDVRNETGKGNQIFDRATTAVADYATKMNQGAVPSSEQMAAAANKIGRALNDPIKGVGLLTRAGVKFTDQQKEQIKKLVESHHTLGAQKIIIDQLHKSYGGAAKAAGGTFAGQIKILQESFRNIAGEITKTFMPALQHLLERATKWITNARNQRAVINHVKQAIHGAGVVANVLITAFKTLAKVTGSNTNAIKLLVAAYATFKIAKIAGNVLTLAGNFGKLSTSTETAAGSSKSLAGAFAGRLGVIASVIAAGVAVSQMIRMIPGWDKAMKGFGGTVYDLAGSLGLVSDPMKQFQGKTVLSAAASGSIRRQAAQLEQKGGLTPQQAAARILAARPNLATHDVQVLAGVYGHPAGMVVHINHFHSGAQNVREFENELKKQHRGRPDRRRGDP